MLMGFIQLRYQAAVVNWYLALWELPPRKSEIGNRSKIEIELKNDSKQLGEVVVTALGQQREKKALAYAITNVKGDLLQQRSEPDPLRALSGKVPGVNIISGGGAPGQGTKLTSGEITPLRVVTSRCLWWMVFPFDNSSNGLVPAIPATRLFRTGRMTSTLITLKP